MVDPPPAVAARGVRKAPADSTSRGSISAIVGDPGANVERPKLAGLGPMTQSRQPWTCGRRVPTRSCLSANACERLKSALDQPFEERYYQLLDVHKDEHAFAPVAVLVPVINGVFAAAWSFGTGRSANDRAGERHSPHRHLAHHTPAHVQCDYDSPSSDRRKIGNYPASCNAVSGYLVRSSAERTAALMVI